MLGWSLITFSENSLFAIVYSTHYTLAVVALEMTGFVRTSRNATMRRAMSRHLSFSLLSDEPHQLIWQQHMCGTLGVSPLECEVVGQSYKTLYFHYQHPPSWNDPSKSVAQKNKLLIMLSNPLTSPGTARPDSSGRWDDRMAAQHLPVDSNNLLKWRSRRIIHYTIHCIVCKSFVVFMLFFHFC